MPTDVARTHILTDVAGGDGVGAGGKLPLGVRQPS